MLLKDLEDAVVRSGSKCFYEVTSRYTTNHPERSESRIKSNFTIQPVVELSIVPSGVLLVSEEPDAGSHLPPQLASAIWRAPLHLPNWGVLTAMAARVACAIAAAGALMQINWGQRRQRGSLGDPHGLRPPACPVPVGSASAMTMMYSASSESDRASGATGDDS